MNHHKLIVGKSGSGKSVDSRSENKQLIREKKSALVLIDPHGTLAKDTLMDASEMRQLHRVIYDRLADTGDVVGYEFLTPSTSSDDFIRFTENDDVKRKFAALLVRRGGAKDTSKNPIIEDGIFKAIQLYLNQKEPVPLYWLADLYTPFSTVMDHMIRNCTDPAVKAECEAFRYLNPSTFDARTGPADRRLKALLKTPSFTMRCEPSFDLDAHLANKGILLIDGEGCNPDAAAVMMSAIIWKVIVSCKKYHHRTQIVIDEANNFGLVGLQESQALAEVRKWNLGITQMVQILNFPEEEITINVMQNTNLHRYFCQGSPMSAAVAASDIAKRIVDPMKVHHTEYRVRNVDDGFERIENGSTSVTVNADGEVVSKTESHNTSILKKNREVIDAQDRYMSLNDQETLIQQQLMKLGVGWRWDAGDKEPYYIPMEKDLCHHLSGILSGPISEKAIQKLRESKLQKALAQVKESPAYRKPVLIPIPSKPDSPPQAKGAAQRQRERRGTK